MDSSEDDARYPAPAGLSTQPGLSTDSVESVARSAGVVGAATLASRVLGLIRDIVLANVFLTRATDAFFIAFTIPNTFRRLVGEGALTVAFVPVFTGSLQRSRAEARHAFNATWTLTALVGLVLSVLGVVFAEELVWIFAPGFAADPGKLELCAYLLRICFPYVGMLSLVAVAMGALNAVGHFFTPAIAPVLLNLCIISAALFAFTGPALDEPIVAVAIAVTVAGVLQLLAQVPPLVARDLSPRPVFEPGHPVIRRLAVVMGPAVVGASVFQLNLLVVRFLSSFLGDGAVSYLFYADRMLEFPLGVFVFAIGTASLPSLSRLVKRGEREPLLDSFSATMAFAVALALPSTLGLMMLREPIFQALFAWNEVFDADAVAGCASALLPYSLGLVPITVSRICVQLCLAHEDTAAPARAAVISLLVNIGAALALIGPMPSGALPPAVVAFQHQIAVADLGYAGLALATSIAAAANALYLVVWVRVRYGAFRLASDLVRWTRIAIATGAMSAVLVGVGAVAPVPERASLAGVALLALHVAVGAVVYLAALAILRSPELVAFRAMLRRGSRVS